MNGIIPRPKAVALLLLFSFIFATPIAAQQKRPAPAKPQPKAAVAPAPAPAPTFDTLVPAGSYTVYGEVRGVGHLIRSTAVNELLEPIIKLAGPPKEFRSLIKWIGAHADEVMSSRMLIATWAVAKDVPDTIIAIEFASAEEAAKFAKPLDEFLPTVFPSEPAAADPTNKQKTPEPPKPNYHLQQAGSLILITPKPLTLSKLKPAGSKPLSEDNNFRMARNRFNSESVFVYFDIEGMERKEEENRKQYEETRRQEAERAQQQKAAAETEEKEPETPDPAVVEQATLAAGANTGPTVVTGTLEPAETPNPNPVSAMFSALGGSFFSGAPKWPEGIAVALTLENDSFDLRGLFVNQPGEKSDMVPFVPMLIPGPPLVPESPNILPADTELFAAMSVDLTQIYNAMARPRPSSTQYTSHGILQTVHQPGHETPFSVLESRLKMNLRDDILPLLGSEVAIRFPLMGVNFFGLPQPPPPKPDDKEEKADEQSSTSSAPVLLISLKDKEGLRALMPKLVEALGFKGASALASTERREDTELVSYVGLFSYAFVGNFIVLSAEPAAIRHVVDSYLKHETLSGNGHFRSYTRWQPRPMHGQLYISPSMMEGYKSWAENPNTRLSHQTRAFLTRLTQVAQPITYSLSNEGLGPLHELHIPKNLVLMAVAGISGETNPPPELRNERLAMGMLFTIAHAQEQFKTTKGGSYGTLEQLIAAGMVPKEILDKSGYNFDVTVSGDKYEVTAVPTEYGKTGNLSYFINETRILRGGDRNGASATSSDPPIN